MAFDHERVTAQMQVNALSVAVMKLLARHFATGDDPEEVARQWLNLTEIESDNMAFEGIPAEWSDHASQLYRESAVKLALQARALATGARYDPDDFQKSWRIDPDPSSSS